MSNYIKNTKKVLKAYNQQVIDPQIAKINGDLAKLGTDLDAKASQVLADAKTYTDAEIVKLDTKLQGQMQEGLELKVDKAELGKSIPVLNGQGKLDTSVLPSIAVNEKFTATSIQEAMELTMEIGDVLIINPTNEDLVMKQLASKGMHGGLVFLCVDPEATEFEKRFRGLYSDADSISKGEVLAALELKADKTDLNAKYEELLGKINGKVSIEDFEVEVGKLDKAIEDVLANNTKIAEIEARVETNEGKIAELETTTKSHGSRLTHIEEYAYANREQINGLKTRVTALEEDIKELSQEEIQSIIDFIKA